MPMSFSMDFAARIRPWAEEKELERYSWSSFSPFIQPRLASSTASSKLPFSMESLALPMSASYSEVS